MASAACDGYFGRHIHAWRATLGVAVAHAARLTVAANQAAPEFVGWFVVFFKDGFGPYGAW